MLNRRSWVGWNRPDQLAPHEIWKEQQRSWATAGPAAPPLMGRQLHQQLVAARLAELLILGAVHAIGLGGGSPP